MASKTYVPGLIVALKLISKYGKKWQVHLQGNLTTPQYDCLVAVLDAVTACLVALNAA